ncbi:MAG TPA: D-glycerate dehydrogenase [Gemmatimonadaceae bacterium]|nr:D-glycerate dehydrogenase [Gemmatimonadaceae bacterium]
MPSRPTVVVTRRLPAPVEARLGELFHAHLNPEDRPLDAAALAEAVRTADALLCTVTDRITQRVLSAEPQRVRIIANYGVGFNHIDVEAARARDIVVTNTPGVLTDDTADLAMTLLLTVARRTGEGERALRDGAWTGWGPTRMLGTRVTGKTLGLIGLGRIGAAVAQRAHQGFGMRVIFYDPAPVPADHVRASAAEPRDTIEEVLRESDFVSLHCPSTPDTHHLMNAERLRLMRPDAFLINTARGDVVDEAALVDVLCAHVIAGAALDVFEREPAVTPGLLGMENVVLTPHLGSATVETRVAMGERAIVNLVAFFDGAPPPDRVA